MARFVLYVMLAVASMTVSGCAPPVRDQQPHAYAGPRLEDSQVAIIYGNNGGGGDRVNLNILGVDDINVRVQGRGARKAFVLPGARVIHIGALNGNYFSGNLSVTETFKAGHIYQIRHSLDAPDKKSKGIHLWLEDMGTNYVPPVEIFPSS